MPTIFSEWEETILNEKASFLKNKSMSGDDGPIHCNCGEKD
jgi:hypothetical protein